MKALIILCKNRMQFEYWVNANYQKYTTLVKKFDRVTNLDNSLYISSISLLIQLLIDYINSYKIPDEWRKKK